MNHHRGAVVAVPSGYRHDRCSLLSIEGLGQKIFLDRQLADLGVKLLDLRLLVAGLPRLLAREDPRKALAGMALPLHDRVRMYLVTGCKLGQILVALQGLKCYLRLRGCREIPPFRHIGAQLTATSGSRESRTSGGDFTLFAPVRRRWARGCRPVIIR